MAKQVDESCGETFVAQTTNDGSFSQEGECHDPQINQISKMLSHHDTDGRLSIQINQCLIDDGITLQLLSNFDDDSLQATIKSWNLDQYHKKPFIIRGLLVNGIKQMNSRIKLQTQTQNKTETITPGSVNSSIKTNTSSNNNHGKMIISEMEMQMMHQLLIVH